MDRNKRIIRVSIVGIVANVLLATAKAVIGLIAGSIAIVMDAVNNLSDVLSSVITIVGTKLSARPADAKHPFGYGRVEYFSAIVISLIVVSAGVASLVESVGKIIEPSEPQYTTTTLIIVSVAIIVKLLLGIFVKKQGKMLKSDALVASGADALFDAIITFSTLVSAGIMIMWNVNLDGIFGTLISVLIIKAGIEMLASPIGELLGSRISPELVSQIKETAMSFENVRGVYDIIINNYGPNVLIGSLHISIPETITAREIHLLTRSLTEAFYDKFGAIMTIGIYSIYTADESRTKLQHAVLQYVNTSSNVAQAHAFYIFEERKLITLDVIPDGNVKDDTSFANELKEVLHKQFTDYDFDIVVDHNYC